MGLAFAIAILLLASPMVVADPMVEKGIDDGCSTNTLAETNVSVNEVVVAAGAADHCAYLIVLP